MVAFCSHSTGMVDDVRACQNGVVMFGKRAAWLAIAVSALLAVSGCSKPEVVQVDPGTEFTLSVGQSASIPGEGLQIEFVEVISDSRCPTGATCIWAGEASCLIEITDGESTYSKVLTQPGLSTPSTTDYAAYGIAYDILPYPELGKETKAEEYRLQLTITERPA
ncbi:hypothetical protein ACFLUT_04165 [Chloroflexota bacterium]